MIDLPGVPVEAAIALAITVLAGEALNDPVFGNPDRIQVVILWMNGDDWRCAREAACPDQLVGKLRHWRRREMARSGRTVDHAAASYTNKIGAAGLTGEWSDADLDLLVRRFITCRAGGIDPAPSIQHFKPEYVHRIRIDGHFYRLEIG